MSTDLGRLTIYPAKSALSRSPAHRSVRSLRFQSHPLTRLLRDSLAPTLQFVTIFLIGVAIASFALKHRPGSTSELSVPHAGSALPVK